MKDNATRITCLNCGLIFVGFPSAKRKFCNVDCSLLWRIKGEDKKLRVSPAERQRRFRERNYNKLHTTCECGGEKYFSSKACADCTYKARADTHPANYKGGMANHLKHVRERSTKLKINGSHTDEEWESLKERTGNMCLCCKAQSPLVKLTRDHIIPVSRGGSHDISNIQPLCMSCNVRKYTNIINYLELPNQNKAGVGL